MTVIAQDVFIISMNLMDEQSEDGTFEGYPEEYRRKAWTILTLLQAELLGPSYGPIGITSEQDPLLVDERAAVTVLSYGLASHLLLTEDKELASFFNDRYDELKRKRPAKIAPIKDVYGIKEGTEEKINDPTVSGIDGGSFTESKSGKYDGGAF